MKFGSNRKLGLERTMNGVGKPFKKRSGPKNKKKNSKKLSVIAACEQKTTSEKDKFGSNKKLGLEWTINGLKKAFRK